MLTKNKRLFRFDSCLLVLQNSFFFSFDIAFLLYRFRFFSLYFLSLLYRFRRFFRWISFSYFTDFVGFCFRFVSFRFFSFLSLPVPEGESIKCFNITIYLHSCNKIQINIVEKSRDHQLFLFREVNNFVSNTSKDNIYITK